MRSFLEHLAPRLGKGKDQPESMDPGGGCQVLNSHFPFHRFLQIHNSRRTGLWHLFHGLILCGL